ncbi:MAG: glycosyl hydrolase 53 family protein [Prevotella sp.]|nr:glycosyl hydrolase 53 family protein [Prevotella sp.]
MRQIITILLLTLTLPTFADGKFVGGDISLLPSYIDHGAKYYDNAGNAINDPLAFFGEQGLNAMRVRLFVNPENAPSDHKGQGVVQDLAYVKRLGKMIKDAGMALMLDFHYSDTWADPAKQWTPAAWAGLSDNELYERIYGYTREVLQEMNAAGATPDFIQTGNEISYGMLWGRSSDNASQLKKCYTNNDSNWSRFCQLLKNAIKACREECPKAQVIIHTERVSQPNVLLAFYDKMKTYGVEYDIIGLSYYSYYHGNLDALNTALNQLESRFSDKKIMLVEVGYFHDWQTDDAKYDLSKTYPITGEGQKAFTEALIETVNKHANVNGLFWWFMEANEYGLDWNTKRVTDGWYNAGLFDNQTGRAEPALSVLKNFLGESAGINQTQRQKDTNKHIYTIDGRQVDSATALPSGIYIVNGRKIVY